MDESFHTLYPNTRPTQQFGLCVYLQSGLGHYCPSPAQPASYMTHPQANLVSSVPISATLSRQYQSEQARSYSSSQAFQTMTLQESNWNMDTGASSHLAENTGMLTSFSNPSLYKSVFVGHANAIPLDSHGQSLLQYTTETLHLHHDYQTRRLLLRCDSTGDLYPVTQQPSSTTTLALLSLSPTTWHRRLGHPSEDVLRRLESSHFISYNKTKFAPLCVMLVN
ncbi:ribonuclease H-like domain-containing protein [Tanacetum coccineum]